MTILPCPRCGNLPSVHKTFLGKDRATSIYCEDHNFIGELSWFFSEELAVCKWNIAVIADEFLTDKITWEEAQKKAISL